MGKTTTTQDFSQTTTPVNVTDWGPLGNLLQQMITSKLNAPTSLPSTYVPQGLSTINKNADLNRTSISNILAARGLSGSPIAGNALTQEELSRAGQTTDFMNQVPLINQALQRQDLATAMGLFSMRPQGQTSTGNSTTTQTTPWYAGIGGILGQLAGSAMGTGGGWGGLFSF